MKIKKGAQMEERIGGSKMRREKIESIYEGVEKCKNA